MHFFLQRYASERLRGDVAVVEEALNQSSLALAYTTWEIRRNRQLALVALRHNEHAVKKDHLYFPAIRFPLYAHSYIRSLVRPYHLLGLFSRFASSTIYSLRTVALCSMLISKGPILRCGAVLKTCVQMPMSLTLLSLVTAWQFRLLIRHFSWLINKLND